MLPDKGDEVPLGVWESVCVLQGEELADEFRKAECCDGGEDLFLVSCLRFLLGRERAGQFPARHLPQLAVQVEASLRHQQDQHQESHQPAAFHHCPHSVSPHQDHEELVDSEIVGVAITAAAAVEVSRLSWLACWSQLLLSLSLHQHGTKQRPTLLLHTTPTSAHTPSSNHWPSN